jgi:adenosylmethionine-8-amino-7-oxononanoate aminotransferase
VACAAALAVQQVIERDGLLAQCRSRGERLMGRLRETFGNHPNVGDIRGRGLFIGLEFVKDRASREPFDPALQMNATLKRVAMENGLMCYPMGGTIDGRRGDHLLLAPPFIATEDDIDQIVLRLDRALGRTLEMATAGSGH